MDLEIHYHQQMLYYFGTTAIPSVSVQGVIRTLGKWKGLSPIYAMPITSMMSSSYARHGIQQRDLDSAPDRQVYCGISEGAVAG